MTDEVQTKLNEMTSLELDTFIRLDDVAAYFGMYPQQFNHEVLPHLRGYPNVTIGYECPHCSDYAALAPDGDLTDTQCLCGASITGADIVIEIAGTFPEDEQRWIRNRRIADQKKQRVKDSEKMRLVEALRKMRAIITSIEDLL